MAARKPKLVLPPVPAKIGWERVETFFSTRGWAPLAFQRRTWEAYARKESGLLHLPTGAGKTYAAYFAPLVEAAAAPEEALLILYLTPLRALARDIEKALRLPVETLDFPIRVEARTGDTSSSARARQRKSKPHVLVTTPESLSLLLSYETAATDFAKVRAIIIDEWHELISTKRGSLLELTLSRLRSFAPEARTWALSATLANVQEAARAAVGTTTPYTVIDASTSALQRDILIESILPEKIERFPWAGHLGLTLLPQILDLLANGRSTLLFTNTRSQAERWYRALVESLPERTAQIALHHGSLDRKERERVEEGLKDGTLRAAVCTSSLDLGIDLSPVEQVVQIGSPKAIARLIQRAGRASHTPGTPCRILFLPTHAFELLEIVAVRKAIASGEVEARTPLCKPLDVLAQHLVTCALGGGFTEASLFAEVRRTVGYETLTPEEFQWAMVLVRDGGATLGAYPDYHRIREVEGSYRVPEARLARRHRLNIGTIVSDATVLVRFARGPKLGSIEEHYITRLRRGDRFLFAGRLLELVLVRDLVAYVRKAKGGAKQTPRWNGGHLPISPALSSNVRRELGRADEASEEAEIRALRPVLQTQKLLSQIPAAQQVLTETCDTREGAHCFLFPFEGRLVHEGLAALLAYRFSRWEKTTFALAVNDYGIEMLAPRGYPFHEFLSSDTNRAALFSDDDLEQDILASVNLSELARRQFRSIARVAGLIVQRHGGSEKTSRQLQASSSLLFDVFTRYDPENLLLQQAKGEVLTQHFEQSRLANTLQRMQQSELVLRAVKHPTPFALPLLVARMGATTFSAETLAERVERMIKPWNKATETSSSRGKRSRSSRNERSSGLPSEP